MKKDRLQSVREQTLDRDDGLETGVLRLLPLQLHSVGSSMMMMMMLTTVMSGLWLVNGQHYSPHHGRTLLTGSLVCSCCSPYPASVPLYNSVVLWFRCEHKHKLFIVLSFDRLVRC